LEKKENIKRGIVVLLVLLSLPIISGSVSDHITSLSTRGSAISEVSAITSTSGLYSARLQADDPADPNEGRINITFNPPITLGEIINISWMQNVTAGYIAHIDIRIDVNGDGLPDDALVFEYDKVKAPSDQLVTAMAFDRDEWVSTFDDKGIVDSNAKAWLSSGPPGPASADNETFFYHSLASWKSGPPTNQANGKTVNNNTNVTALELEVDGWILESEAFIDDILINGELAEDFEPINNIVINEFTVDPQTDWSGNGPITDSDEFIELYNNNSFDVDITSWVIFLNDSDENIETIGSTIPAKGFFTILNPSGTQNNNGLIFLLDSLGALVDSVTYGNYDDGNTSDNAPDGGSNDNSDECLARIPNGIDSNVDSSDFIKTFCTFNSTNLPIWNISIENKIHDPVCILTDENVTLFANVSSNLCIEKVIFSLFANNTWQNFTGSSSIFSTGNYSTLIPSSYLSQNKFFNWTVYVIDCFNRTAQNGIHNFSVNSRTNLTVNPDNPNGLNGWYISEPLFTLTNPDATSLYYQWDSTGLLTYTSPFGLEDAPNDGNTTGGILELNYNSNVCNETQKSQLFKTDFTNPLITNLVPSNNSNITTTLKPTIQALLDEIYQSNSGIDKSSVSMLINGILVSINVLDSGLIDAIARHNPPSNLAEGNHTVTINVSDNAGRFSTLTWFFNINVTDGFNLTVLSPQNANYNTRRIPFEIQTSDKSSIVDYINFAENRPRFRRLCRNCDEYGFLRIKKKTLKEGQNNITIRAMDMFGNTREKNISLFIDSKPPKISRTTPKRNTITNGSSFEVKYTENNLKSVQLSINPIINLSNCNLGINQACSTSVNLSEFDGSFIEYLFNLSDGINTKQSRSTRVFVDTISPNMVIFMPQNNSNFTRRAQFDITISEKVKLEFFDILDSNPRWRRLCTNCDEYGNSRNKTKSFRKGNHALLIRAIDKAGNSQTKSITFTVL
jgi:hypothetical protein